MDITAIRKGLAAAVRTALPELTCYHVVPLGTPEVPAFYVAGPTITYDTTFGGSAEVDNWVCRVLTSRADDEAGQDLLDAFLSPGGARSVKAAIEGTPGIAQTLGGVCDDVHVRRAQNYGLFEHAGIHFYGAELVVHVIGD